MIARSPARLVGATLALLLARPPVQAAKPPPPLVPPEQAMPHMISLVNDGRLARRGLFKQTPDGVRRAMMGGARRVGVHGASGPRADEPKSKVLLYAHGGVTSENGGLRLVKDLKRVFGDTDVHPVVFVWRTDIATTLVNMVQDQFRARAHQFERKKLRFARFRAWLDRWVERLAKRLRFGGLWSQMKENARLSSERSDGGARIAAEALADRIAANPDTEVHIAGHSAGTILLAHMLRLFQDGKVTTPRRLRIASATLLAPACTVELFDDVYMRALRSGMIGRLRIVNLDDHHERTDNLAFVYGRSILYMVQNSFERRGAKVLGLQETFWTEPGLQQLIMGRQVELAISPNTLPHGNPFAAGATRHKDFAHDEATLQGLRTVVLQGDLGAGPE